MKRRKKTDRSPDAHLDRCLSIHRRLLRIHSLVARVATSIKEATYGADMASDTDALMDLEGAVDVLKGAAAFASSLANSRVVAPAERRVVQSNVDQLAPVVTPRIA